MDQIMGKVGGYWFNQKANKELEDMNVRVVDVSMVPPEPPEQSVSSSIGDGAKWMVNKIKGKMQKPLPEFLKEYDLPTGLFPQDATNYELNEDTKLLTVYIASPCEVSYKDSSVLRFATNVTGYLEKGKMTHIEGLKTKILIWTKVTEVRTEATKVHFAAGMNKTRNRDAYEVVRDGVVVDKF